MDYINHIPTIVVTAFFIVLWWLAKGRIERMEQDIKSLRDNDIANIKKDVVWKDTYDQFCRSMETSLERIENKLDNLLLKK